MKKFWGVGWTVRWATALYITLNIIFKIKQILTPVVE